MGLLAEVVSVPYSHGDRLLVLAFVAGALALIGASLLVRRAPGVSIALVGAVAAGWTGFILRVSEGPNDVPRNVIAWSTAGLLVAGLVGLVATRARPPSRFFWRAAVTCVAVAPFVSLLVFLSVRSTGPLYQVHRVGVDIVSIDDDDMLGGWATKAAYFAFVDAFVLMTLFLISGKQASRREGITLGDDEWARLGSSAGP